MWVERRTGVVAVVYCWRKGMVPCELVVGVVEIYNAEDLLSCE